MKRLWRERLVFALLTSLMGVVLAPVGLIVGMLLHCGSGAISWEFLTRPPENAMTEGGIWPCVVGTLYLVIGTIVVALPVGVIGALYLTEYASQNKLTRLIRLCIVNLAGVPSVVYGLFGLGLFVLFLRFGTSILAGSLTLAILILPLVITATEEALRGVPPSFREASLSLGATQWQTIRFIVLPSAVPGILTGAILGVGRAAGETAPVLFTVAAYYLPHLPKSIFDQAMVLPYHLYTIATQVPDADPKLQWGTALVLVLLVLLMNLAAIVIRSRLRRARL